MDNKIFLMPKVELHLHLDGSVSIDLLKDLSGLSYDNIMDNAISHDDANLSEYLKCFDFINQFLQTKENLEKACLDVARRLEKENVIYAEVRFAPILHTKLGLSLDEIIETVTSSFKKSPIKINVIVCLMRGFSKEENMNVLKCANKYLNKGVVAIDLAGDEEHFPFKDYEYFFNVCKYANIPVTIHAGETSSRDILDVSLYTKRIGHGIKIVDDFKLINMIKEKKILLEICPNSNIDTKNVSDYYHHPIKKLYEDSVLICINTDNMTVSNISLNEEYMHLYRTFQFNIDDFKKMNINAVEYAFISDSEKKKLIEIISEYK